MDKPTYKGIVQFNRISGSTRLYRSNITNQNFVALRVYTAKDEDHFGSTRVYRDKEVVEVYLSANQFSELLTTMNMGEGVPCTVKHINCVRSDLSELDEQEKSAETASRYFKESVAERVGKLDILLNKSRRTIEDAKASKKVKDELTTILYMLEQEIKANMPFYAQRFEEVAKKTVTEVKSEIDAFITGGVVGAGLKALGLDTKKMLGKD